MKHIILITLGFAFALPLYAEEAKAPEPAKAPEEAKPAGAEKPKPDPKKMFTKKDTNSDGSLSKEEFVAKAKNAAQAETAFGKKDKDGDSKLSLEEFTAQPGKGGKGGKGGKKNK